MRVTNSSFDFIKQHKTPVKYYGGYLENAKRKYIIGLDWLELSCKGELFFLNKATTYKHGKTELKRNDIKSRFYTHCFNVYHDSELFGYIMFEPRSEIIPQDSVQFKIDNQQFYKRQRLEQRIKTVLSDLGLLFHNFTRQDIYIDFHHFNDALSFNDFISLYQQKKIESKGKVKNWNVYSTRVKSEMQITGFSYGSRTSDKFLRCYNKTIELEHVHKPYIKKFWELNGLNPNEHVYRFELQLNSKFFHKTTFAGKLNLHQKTSKIVGRKERFFSLDLSSLISLLELSLKNYFEFYEQQNKVRNDEKPAFHVFDWNYIKGMAKSVYTYVREKIVHKSTTWRQKMILVRNLFREYIHSQQNENWLKYLAKVVFDYDLNERFAKHAPRYFEEFQNQTPLSYNFDFDTFKSQYVFNAHLYVMSLNKNEQLKINF